MKEKTVLITGNFSFPKGNAAGKRVLGLGYIFRDLGYRVIFAGCEKDRNSKGIMDTRQEYEEFVYYNFDGSREIRNILNIDKAYKEFIEIIEGLNNGDIFLVILYGSPVLASWGGKVIKYCKKKNIKIMFDCVDWIEKSGFDSLLKNIVKYLDTNYMKRYLACECDGVICVSSYLSSYYRNKGKKTIVIPPVGIKESNIDHIHECKVCPERDDIIQFVYAGSIQNSHGMKREELKDRIDLTIELIQRILNKGINIRLDIYGIDKDQYIKCIPEHRKIIDGMARSVFFHGKTNNNEVCDRIKKADFTIFNRSVSKVTMAGFPSKVSESLLMGTPVITNDTSDIRKYIKSYVNGLIIDFDLQAAEKQIVNICKDRKLIEFMKKSCHANNCFEYQRFVNKMRLFLEEL